MSESPEPESSQEPLLSAHTLAGLRLHRVEIENFRNFVHLQLDPFPTTAVVVGENGVGKSNFLHALRLVLDPSLPDSRRQLRPEDISDYAPHALADGIEVRVVVELAGFDDNPAAKAELDGCIVSVDPYVARLTYLFRPLVPAPRNPSGESSADERSLTIDDYEWVVYGGDDESQDARRVRRSVSLSVLPALRDAVGDLATSRRSPLTELLEGAAVQASALNDAIAKIDSAMDGLAADPALMEVTDELSGRIVRMAGPQLQLQPTLGVTSSRPAQLLRSLRLFVDSMRTRTVADTSTGNANVVYLALLLERLVLRRRADRVVDTLLAVEEPEAHLHPGLQRHLFGYLLREADGLMLTTHSPHIAAVAPLRSIVLLTRDQATQGTVARTTAHTRVSSTQASDLERYLDVTRAEILFARLVIFVEGAAETYLLPALAAAAGFSLDAYGVVVASVAGTDFVPYRRLCGPSGLAIPHVVVTDGDRYVGQKWLGLDRAAGLLERSPADAARLREGAKALREESEGSEDEDDLRACAADEGVFVGYDTLEVDMVGVIGQEMVAAYRDLVGSTLSQKRFEAAIEQLAGADVGMDRDAARKLVLTRIDRIGKGRFAQRLASIIEGWAAGELARRIGDAGEGAEGGDPHDGSFASQGNAGYLMDALDRASRMSRGQALLPGLDHEPPPEQERV